MTAGKTRRARVERKTRETEIELELDLDGGDVAVETGVGFFDHMLDAFGKHGRFGLRIRARGDLHIDQHHLVEDVGIALGAAVRDALGEDLRIRRFGHAFAPLDEALARVVVDICGRAYLGFRAQLSRPRVGDFDTDLVAEFFRAFVHNAAVNLQVDLLAAGNAHHEIEALFKATALALRSAVERDHALRDVPSTKGTLREKDARKD